MTESGFCGIKFSLQFNFLPFNASQKEMGEKQDQGRLRVAEKCASWIFLCPPLWAPLSSLGFLEH